MEERIEALKKASLSDRDRAFADSLIEQYERSDGTLSLKQWYWVDKLTNRVTTKGKREENIGDCKAIYELLTHAAQHLKWPKVTFAAGSRIVQIKLAGQRSKYAGKVLLTDGKPFGQNEWFGYIEPNGIWVQPSRGVPPEVQVFVKKLAADPAGAASEYGRLTGQCCFCNLPLTDERSTTVGYGPVCADHFGLPWGEKKKEG